jgi:hypothetical protein
MVYNLVAVESLTFAATVFSLVRALSPKSNGELNFHTPITIDPAQKAFSHVLLQVSTGADERSAGVQHASLHMHWYFGVCLASRYASRGGRTTRGETSTLHLVSNPAVRIRVLCYRPPQRGNHKTTGGGVSDAAHPDWERDNSGSRLAGNSTSPFWRLSSAAGSYPLSCSASSRSSSSIMAGGTWA